MAALVAQTEGEFARIHALTDQGLEATLAAIIDNPSWEQWFPGFLRRHRAQLRKGDIDTMAFIARRSLDACLQSALAERPLALDDPAFRREVLTLLLNYLLK